MVLFVLISKMEKSSKKIYLEPKSAKFQEIVYNNTLQKYEALFGKAYEGSLSIKLIEQKPRERIFHYSKGVMKAWYGVYEIEGDEDILTMILDTGMGANCMKGLGLLEVVTLKQKIDKYENYEPSKQTIRFN